MTMAGSNVPQLAAAVPVSKNSLSHLPVVHRIVVVLLSCPVFHLSRSSFFAAVFFPDPIFEESRLLIAGTAAAARGAASTMASTILRNAGRMLLFENKLG
jgi:hypothetical protein